MKKYNDTTYAILGILTTGCRSGYEIKQFMDKSLNHFWKISYGQIYPTLKRLEQEGLAVVETNAEEGKPHRKEYFLTTKGEDALHEWLKEPLKNIPTERNEVLLKLFFGRHQTKEHSVALLQDYQQKLEAEHEMYQQLEEMIASHGNAHADAKYWLFTLDYGKRIMQATIAWCEATIEEI